MKNHYYHRYRTDDSFLKEKWPKLLLPQFLNLYAKKTSYIKNIDLDVQSIDINMAISHTGQYCLK